jgi:hypothetical protein
MFAFPERSNPPPIESPPSPYPADEASPTRTIPPPAMPFQPFLHPMNLMFDLEADNPCSTTSMNDGSPASFTSLFPAGGPPEDRDQSMAGRKAKGLLSSPETRLQPRPSQPESALSGLPWRKPLPLRTDQTYSHLFE